MDAERPRLPFQRGTLERDHEALRVTPAMEPRVSSHVSTWEESLGLNGQRKAVA
jgi:hypothetical protein